MNYQQAKTIIKRDVGWSLLWYKNPIIKLSDHDLSEISPADMLIDMADYIPALEYLKTLFDCHDQTFDERKEMIDSAIRAFVDEVLNDPMIEVTRSLGHMAKKIRKARGFAWSKPHAYCIFLWGSKLWIYDRGDILSYTEAMKSDYFRKIYQIKGASLLGIIFGREERDLILI